jgi:hypothetical protein
MEKNCNNCGAKCCKYVVIELDIPEKAEDFEEIKWFVAHENVQVFIEEDGAWNVEFITPCKYLTKENLCSIHEDFVKNPKVKRSNICKEFSTEDCPHHNEYNEIFSFKKIEDVEEYIEKIFNAGLHRLKKDEED